VGALMKLLYSKTLITRIYRKSELIALWKFLTRVGQNSTTSKHYMNIKNPFKSTAFKGICLVIFIYFEPNTAATNKLVNPRILAIWR